MTSIPDITLNDGHSIPQLGYGTWQVPSDEAATAVMAALEAGYRHIDTAEMYRNEHGVSEGIRASSLAREDVYITSKLANDAHAPNAARAAFEGTLEALGTDYVDLFLIHWPMPQGEADFEGTWKAFEELRADGRARSIGVSNFQVAHLERLAAASDLVPAVNQVEVHPFHTNQAVRLYGQERGIATEAWSPLAQGATLADPLVTEIAQRLERAPSQIVLRWHIQRGDIVFPKTMSAERMRENLDVFGFELGAQEMAALSGLDRGASGRTGPHPDEIN